MLVPKKVMYSTQQQLPPCARASLVLRPIQIHAVKRRCCVLTALTVRVKLVILRRMPSGMTLSKYTVTAKCATRRAKTKTLAASRGIRVAQGRKLVTCPRML
jgi:hypothetical protein